MTTTEYGLYFEGGRFVGKGTESELRPLIASTLATTPPDKVADLRVGEMREASVTDYIDRDYILEHWENRDVLTPRLLVDMVATQYHDVVEDGSAHLIPNAAAFQDRSLFDTDKGYAKWVVKWMTKNIALDPESLCEGYPVKTITLHIPTTVLAPTISQVRKWLTSQGWKMTPLIPPFERWVKDEDVYGTQLPNDDSFTDWCDVIQRWISKFAELSKYVGTPMTEEFIYRSIAKETP